MSPLNTLLKFQDLIDDLYLKGKKLKNKLFTKFLLFSFMDLLS